MGDMVSGGSKYTDEDRREAAIQYAVKGNLNAVGRALLIPIQTLRDWSKTDWWDSTLVQVRAENAHEHIASYDRLTRKALALAEQGIDKLDPDTLKANDIKALVVTGATATDKGLLLDGKPTNITGSTESMAILAQTFRDMSAENKRIMADNKAINDSVVSEQ